MNAMKRRGSSMATPTRMGTREPSLRSVSVSHGVAAPEARSWARARSVSGRSAEGVRSPQLMSPRSISAREKPTSAR